MFRNLFLYMKYTQFNNKIILFNIFIGFFFLIFIQITGFSVLLYLIWYSISIAHIMSLLKEYLNFNYNNYIKQTCKIIKYEWNKNQNTKVLDEFSNSFIINLLNNKLLNSYMDLKIFLITCNYIAKENFSNKLKITLLNYSKYISFWFFKDHGILFRILEIIGKEALNTSKKIIELYSILLNSCLNSFIKWNDRYSTLITREYLFTLFFLHIGKNDETILVLLDVIHKSLRKIFLKFKESDEIFVYLNIQKNKYQCSMTKDENHNFSKILLEFYHVFSLTKKKAKCS